MRWAIVVILAAIPAAAASADGDDLAAARDEVRKAYADRIKKAARTPLDRDDAALARELLAKAANSSGDPTKRLALIEVAFDLAAEAGMPQCMEIAATAITLGDGIAKYPGHEKSRRHMVIAVKRYDRLKAEKADYSARDPAAREAADACLNYVLAALPDIDRLPAASKALAEARKLIRQYSSDHLLGKFGCAEDMLAAAERRRNELTKARLALETALERDDEAAIGAARIKLATVVMEFDGDVAAAAELVAETDDARAAGMAAAGQSLAGKDVPAEQLLEASLVLTQWIKALKGPARSRAGDAAMKICGAAISKATDKKIVARAKVVDIRLRQLLGRTEGDEMLAKLQASYGRLFGKLEVLDEGRVRVRYDFEDEAHTGDWRTRNGQWEVDEGRLFCRSVVNINAETQAENKLRFRADRPYRLTFKAAATHQAAMALRFAPWGGGPIDGYYASLGAPQVIKRMEWPDLMGARMRVFGTAWGSTDVTLSPGKWHRFELSLDGKGGLTWRIDDELVRQYAPAKPHPEQTAGSVELLLITRGTSAKAPTGFDSLVIEGHILPAPDWRPTN